MREKWVAGNWKMNLNWDEADALHQALLNKKANWPKSVNVLIAPPAVYLQSWVGKGMLLAAQDCSAYDSGAFTGELSAPQLKSIGVDYCLVGHSERRAYHNESHDLLKHKVRQCLEEDIRPIFCFGEELKQRENGEAESTVEAQLRESLFSYDAGSFSKLILAYEPVWAIGTGKTASAEQAQEMHAFVRSLVSQEYGEEVANNLTILYGGSCKPGNAAELFSGKDVDGGLIGGASLKAEDFEAIINARA